MDGAVQSLALDALLYFLRLLIALIVKMEGCADDRRQGCWFLSLR